MDRKDRDHIQKNYMALYEAISPDIKLLTKDLWTRNLLSKAMQESILEKHKTDTDRAMALLDLVPRRGEAAFETLYTSCISRELWDAADILRPENKPHCPEILPPSEPKLGGEGRESSAADQAESSDDEKPPDVWPPTQAPDLHRMKVYTVADLAKPKECKYKQKYKKTQTPEAEEQYFSMRRPTPGRAFVFVIDNEEFTTLSKRDGTKLDRLAIKTLFDKIGCKVLVSPNLTKDKMWEELKKKKEMDFKPYDCFILFILTHGHEGVVFGTDGKAEKDDKGVLVVENALEIQKITDLFCEVDSLRGKPKLFFIQACQGSDKDAGKPVIIHNRPDDATDAIEEKSNNLGFLAEEKKDGAGDKLPSRADCFVAMATTPGDVSWRRPDFGTWFIQAVAEVFSRYAYKKDLLQLMTMVNNRIQKAETAKGSYKQVMEFKATWAKLFYFFPGLSNPEEIE